MQQHDSVCSPETCVLAEAPNYFYDANGVNITATVCSYWLNYTANATTTRLNVVRNILLNRLSNSSTALSTALASYLTALDGSAPEVYSFVVADTGVDPQVYPYLVRCYTCGRFRDASSLVCLTQQLQSHAACLPCEWVGLRRRAA